jgi:hypothetical protein
MKKFTVKKPTRVRVNGRQFIIRAGEKITVLGSKTDHYEAYPIKISSDVAEKYFGIKAEESKPKKEVKENGS